MAKIANYKTLFFAISIFVLASSLSFSGIAFADVQEGVAYHPHVTALTDPNLVCGNHMCTPGEMPQPPTGVIPTKGVQ